MPHEFNVSRLRIIVALGVLFGLIFLTVSLMIQAEDINGVAAGAIFATMLAWPLTFLVRFLFAPNPVLTITKSEICYRAGIFRPVPWSACWRVSLATPDKRFFQKSPSRLTVSVDEIERYAPTGPWIRGVLTGVYPPQNGWISISVPGTKGLDVVRAMAAVGVWDGMHELARVLHGWGARYAEAGEVGRLIARLEKSARTPGDAVALASSLINGNLPMDMPRAERLVDLAIKRDVQHVRDTVKAAAGYDVLLQDICRRRLEAGGHDVSGLPKVDPADLAVEKEKILRGPPPISRWKRLWAAMKSLFYLTIGVAVIAMIIDGVFDSTGNWMTDVIGAIVLGFVFMAFVVDLRFALGITRRGLTKY